MFSFKPNKNNCHHLNKNKRSHLTSNNYPHLVSNKNKWEHLFLFETKCFYLTPNIFFVSIYFQIKINAPV